MKNYRSGKQIFRFLPMADLMTSSSFLSAEGYREPLHETVDSVDMQRFSGDCREQVMSLKGRTGTTDTNADWRVRPVRPLKLPYFILEPEDKYTYTVIGTDNYRYLWIMARESEIDAALLRGIYDRMEERVFTRQDIKFMNHAGR